jgi:hypothetical protein
VALPMRTRTNRKWGRTVSVGLAAWAGLACSASCASSDEAPGRGRVERPVSPGPKAPPPSPTVVPSSAPAAAPSAPSPAPEPIAPAPSVDRPPLRSDHFERVTGIELSPRDKAIFNDCPARSWSKNVPKRRCTNHDACGDGFCDRGRCAALWTCNAVYGQPCKNDDDCAYSYLCNDGRCSSCTSTSECARLPERPRISDVKCATNVWVPGTLMCRGSVGSGPGELPQKPTPQRPTP